MAETDDAQSDSGPSLAAQTKPQDDRNERRARDLAQVLKINPGSFSDNPLAAYEIMAYAATIPLIKEQPKRRQLANEVLLNASRAFPKTSGEFTSPFHGQIAGLVIQMQEFPHWFGIISKSNKDLIEEYKNLLWIIWGLNVVGYSGFAVGTYGASEAIKGATKEVSKLPSPSSARDKLRGAGRGAINGVKGIGTGGLVGRAFVLAWVVGQTTAALAKACKSEVEFEINRRYKDGKMTYKEYQEAFGVGIDPPTKYVYGL